MLDDDESSNESQEEDEDAAEQAQNDHSYISPTASVRGSSSRGDSSAVSAVSSRIPFEWDVPTSRARSQQVRTPTDSYGENPLQSPMNYHHEYIDPAIWEGGKLFPPAPPLLPMMQTSPLPSDLQSFGTLQRPNDTGLKEVLHPLPAQLPPGGASGKSPNAAQMVITIDNPDSQTMMRALEVLANAGCRANILIDDKQK
ncbi:uncharacterized protein PG998_012190 [Apiospora kogelbergensis]|uniref:uncharacterized protein n=1 Tax=Apiospora kogelbergensis TaxID=1337665 RepID=UPI00312EC24E